DKDNLRALAFSLLGNVHHSQNPVAGRLRFWADDRKPLADQRIQQCRLTRIRAAQNAYESGVEGHKVRITSEVRSCATLTISASSGGARPRRSARALRAGRSIPTLRTASRLPQWFRPSAGSVRLAP